MEMEETIHIKDFLHYLWKYALPIALITLACALGVTFYNVNLKTPMYSTWTSILLVKNDTSNNSTNSNDIITQNDITLNQKLVSTYREIIKSRLVLSQVIARLNLGYTVDDLSNRVSVQAISETEILKITVTDSDPVRAADIANKLADVFEVEVTNRFNLNNVSVLDRAQAATAPSNNTTIRDIVLAMFASVVGSTAVVFVIFYFDDRLRYTENMENEIGMPIIAKVFKDKSADDLIVDKKPNALTSESIRTLRTNLQFASIDTELKTLLVTSTIPSEGKSFISANLAVSFAKAGKKVLLIDCDLRKGRQHSIFNVQNKKGLSNILISDLKNYSEYVSKTKIENLSIIPRGAFPPNPSELLNSKKNSTLLEKVRKDYDIIILDGAPCSGLSDSLILASQVDKVLLVSSVNYTPKTELKNIKKDLENIGANIAGCVANNINIKKDSYGGHYYYYSYGSTEQSHESLIEPTIEQPINEPTPKKPKTTTKKKNSYKSEAKK